ncbi:zinc ribbon domain-containing protein [Pantanalinema rosaneae]|uniref:zinc ribbon domain-containing protein n=1 Tax=Pantanalinema rosaneae TaxID=1620701 RepID=UPI003D6DE1A7
MPLKAHGHVGIPLHYATGDQPLCATCAYDEDDTCTLPKRPDARDCSLYCDRTQSSPNATPGYTTEFQIRTWLKRNLVWLALIGLIILSLVVTIMR